MFPFQINTTYNFDTLAPAILGTNFKNATILGILDYTLASNFINPETQHVNIYPYLPVGTIDDPKQYTYVLIKTESGVKTALAMPWIDETSIEVVVVRNLRVDVNNVTEGDANRIRDSLILMGFTSFTVTSV